MSYNLHLFQCVLKSWQNCIQQGLSNEIDKPLFVLSSKELDTEIRQKSKMIQGFNTFFDTYSGLIKNIKGCYYFAVFNKDADLLAVRLRPDTSEDQFNQNYFLEAGVSFREISIGTNAVIMSKLFKKPVYLSPDFHYCNKLKTWHEYCVPLRYRGNIVGYILAISILGALHKTVRGFVDLMGINIFGQQSIVHYDNYSEDNISGELNEKQYLILRMIAQGISDECISKELRINISTVKYHNQNIYKSLNANSRVDAVIKALLNNRLNFYDILNEQV